MRENLNIHSQSEAGRKIVLAMRIAAPKKSSIISTLAHEARMMIALEQHKVTMSYYRLVGDVFGGWKTESLSSLQSKLLGFFKVIASCCKEQERFPRSTCRKRPLLGPHMD